MSTTDNDDLGFEDDDNADDKANAPKALRDQNKKLNKELEDLRKQNAEVQEKLRARDLAEALETHGAPKRLAKYAARDIEDVSEDAVLEWLKENGEDFGWEPAEEEDAEVEETKAQARRISRASSDAPSQRPTTNDQLLHELRTADAKTLREKDLI